MKHTSEKEEKYTRHKKGKEGTIWTVESVEVTKHVNIEDDQKDNEEAVNTRR